MATLDTARHDWVLDLRTNGSASGPDGLRVENATSSGSVHGYAVEAQRRSRDGFLGVCIRLTAPDGRALNAVGYLSSSDTSARTPASSTLSRTVALAFKANPNAEQAAAAAERIGAVIDAGHACLHDGWTGERALWRVQSAAEGIGFEDTLRWREEFPSSYGSWLRVREIAWLIEAGFTPETAREWFNITTSASIGSKTYAQAMAAFRDHGWTRGAARQFMSDFGVAKGVSWAPLGPEHSDLALRAGLRVTAAKRLLRRGEWDTTTLETLAALRADTR